MLSHYSRSYTVMSSYHLLKTGKRKERQPQYVQHLRRSTIIIIVINMPIAELYLAVCCMTNYISREAQPRRKVHWPWSSVCLSAWPLPHSHTIYCTDKDVT